MIRKVTIFSLFMVLLMGSYSSAIDLKGFGEKLKKLNENPPIQEPTKEEPKKQPTVHETGTDKVTQEEEPEVPADKLEDYKTAGEYNTALDMKRPDEKIEPFGSLTWEDGIFDVVVKINNMKDLDNIEIRAGHADGVNIKGVTDKNRLSQKLTNVLENREPLLLKPNDPRVRSYGNLLEFIGKNGDKKKFIAATYEIKAFPIIIKTIPFTLIARFEYSPGLAIYSPEKVLTESKGFYTFPLILTEVLLEAESPSLPDKYQEIHDILHLKYDKYDTPYANKYGYTFNLKNQLDEGNVLDKYGNRFEVSWGTYRYNMSYSAGNDYKRILNEKYIQHLSDLESQKTKMKKDAGSEL